MPVPILSYADIAARADAVFQSHNTTRTIPLDIEHILDVGYGLEIYPRSGLMDRFQIDAFISADLKEIVVDKRVYDQKPPNRYRFSLAHEFAHLILHADVYRSLTFKTPEQWKRAMLDIAEDDYDWLEWQANAFAGLLLVPPDHLRQKTDQLQQQIRAGGLDPSRLDEPGVDRVIRVLAQHFQVSTAVVQTRVRKDRLWPLSRD